MEDVFLADPAQAASPDTRKEVKLVPGEGFEPPTFGLQNRCTTTVLTRRRVLSGGKSPIA